MKNRNSLFIRMAALIAVLVGLCIINGCGTQSPVAPAEEENNDIILFGSQHIESKWGKIHHYNLYQPAKAMVDSAGLDVDLGDFDENASYNVPDDAVDGAVEISCSPTAYYTASGPVYVFQFGPKGIKFKKATTLSLKMRAFKKFKPRNGEFVGAELYYFDPDIQDWKLQEVDTDISDGEVDFEIYHFSRYAIGGRLL